MATNLALTSNVSGATFTWTCTPSSGNVTGFSPGSGLLINQTLVNTGFTIETVIYHITPSANGCNGMVFNYTVLYIHRRIFPIFRSINNNVTTYLPIYH